MSLRDLARDVVVNTDPPKIPWGRIGAAALLALLGLAFWKTTIGKFMIGVGVGAGFLFMMTR